MRIVLTGAHGFLGWHTRVRLHATTRHEIVPVGRGNWAELPRLVAGADAVVHAAGANRGDPVEVERGNIELADQVANAVARATRPIRVVFANSIQSGNGTPYGVGKERAAHVLADAARNAGGHLVDVLLPNLFGEHCRPAYNSFVATFINAVANGGVPEVKDREVGILHVQGAAQSLIDALTTGESTLAPAATPSTVAGVLALIQEFHALYASADLPVLDTPLRVDLFNTYRAALFPERYPIALTAHSDARGRLVETVRAHGGQGQTFVSTTRPGITRGEHFHLGKVERFVVMGGQARISLRRAFHSPIVSFDVSGADPVAIDMPTMWAHNITNTGESELTTLFWTHALFDPDSPDTYQALVGDVVGAEA